MGEELVTEVAGPIARIVFNRPGKHNAISLGMWEKLAATLYAWAGDAAIRTVVLTGAGGKAFVAGADIGEFEKERDSKDAYAAYAERAMRGRTALLDFPKPVVAAINGFCIGAGLSIAMSADIRIASQSATFSMPGAKIGMPCDLAMGRQFVSLVGPAHARSILFLGERFGADEAFRMGLVDRVVPADGLADEALRVATVLAENAPLALRALKMVVNTAAAPPHPAREAEVAAAVAACAESADYRDGRQAVLQKRKPQFRGV